MHTLRIAPISEIIGIAVANMPKEAQNYNALNAATKVIQESQNYGSDQVQNAYRTVEQFINDYPNIPASQTAQNILTQFPSDQLVAPQTPPQAPPQAPPSQDTVTTHGLGDQSAAEVNNTGPSTAGGDVTKGRQVAPDSETAPNQDMMGQMQDLVNQRDEINQQIQQIQQMFGFSNQGQPAQQGGFGMPQPGSMPGSDPGLIDRARNWWNERELGKEQSRGYRQNLQRQRQNLQNQRMQQAANSERPTLTAAMGSASALMG